MVEREPSAPPEEMPGVEAAVPAVADQPVGGNGELRDVAPSGPSNAQLVGPGQMVSDADLMRTGVIAAPPRSSVQRPLDKQLHSDAMKAIDKLIEKTVSSGRRDRFSSIRDLCAVARDLSAINATTAADFDEIEEEGAPGRGGALAYPAYPGPMGEEGGGGIMGRRRRRILGQNFPDMGIMPGLPGGDIGDVNRQLTMQLGEMGKNILGDQEAKARRDAAAELEHLVATKKLLSEDPKTEPKTVERIEKQIQETMTRIEKQESDHAPDNLVRPELLRGHPPPPAGEGGDAPGVGELVAVGARGTRLAP